MLPAMHGSDYFFSCAGFPKTGTLAVRIVCVAYFKNFNLLMKKNCFVKEKMEKKKVLISGGCMDSKKESE